MWAEESYIISTIRSILYENRFRTAYFKDLHLPEKRLYTPKEFLTFIICGAPENKIGLLERQKITVLQLKKENVLSEIIKGLISD